MSDAALRRPPGPNPRTLIESLETLIARRLSLPECDPQDLARRLGVDLAELDLIAEVNHGLTVSELLLERRLEHVVTLIRQEQLAVETAARRSGFTTLTSFLRAFDARYSGG